MEFEKTTRAQRRQTLAKLILGHLLEPPMFHRDKVGIAHRGCFSPVIAADDRSEFPSEVLCAKVALALDERAYQSCNIRDLDDYTVATTLGDEPIVPWGAPR
jgi:hypothetical protein